MGAITNMRQAAREHREANPGHVTEEYDRTKGDIFYAHWTCLMCPAKGREVERD